MARNSIYRAFGRYVSMNVLSMIGLSCYILADTYFISSGVGSLGLAALNIVLPVYSLLSAAGLMLGMGAATRYAIHRGEGKTREANLTFTHTLIIGAVMGAAFTAAGILVAGDLSAWLGADGAVRPLAQKYLRTVLLFSCPFIVNQILVCFVRNDGRPKRAMLAMLCGSFSNVFLDYLFIFPLGWGMFGAAFATGIAPLTSMLVLSVHFLRKENQFHLVRCDWRAAKVSRTFALGTSAFITELSSGVIMMVHNFLLLRLSGSTAVAAYGIVANLALVVVAVFTGVAQGVQPLVSAGLGQGRLDDIQKILRCSVILSILLGLLFSLSGALFAQPLVSLFNSEQNAVLADIAVEGLRLYFTAFVLMGVNIVAAAFFAAVSRPAQSFVISITRGLLAVIPLALLLARLWGLTGVWLTIPCAELFSAVLSAFFLLRCRGADFAAGGT